MLFIEKKQGFFFFLILNPLGTAGTPEFLIYFQMDISVFHHHLCSRVSIPFSWIWTFKGLALFNSHLLYQAAASSHIQF